MQLYDELDQTALHIHDESDNCPSCKKQSPQHVSPAILETKIAELESIIKKERREAVRRDRELTELWIKANDDLHWAAIRQARLQKLLSQSRKRIAELEKLLSILAKKIDQNQAA